MRSHHVRPAAWLLLALPALLSAADNPQLVVPTDPLPAAEQLKLFHLPAGFKIELVAAEPEIRKPINLNFDARGRLYATQSVEYPFPPTGEQKPRDEIRLFTDADRDGRYEKIETFADGLTIPIGVQPLPDAVLGYSIPQIFRFYDADGDGRAESREPVYATFGSQDTHGMASSFNHWIDGWVYACHGFANTSTVQGKDGQPITMNSGNTYRISPDGRHIEYFSHGQVNPFGLAIDPYGNVFTSDCHSKPLYQNLRGAWYPSFSKPHDGLGFGPEMIKHSHGSTGIAGVVYYHADHFPAAYRETLFIGNPVTGKINHDRLDPHGSTLLAVEQPDFLTCDDPWFRPVDLRLGPDGALYVADFYNKIIGHYEVPLTHPGRDRERGRIWKITYVGEGAKPAVSRDLTQASLEQLHDALADQNLVVRTHATHQLVWRGQQSDAESNRVAGLVAPLLAPADTVHPWSRAHALWVTERLGRLGAGEQLAALAKDPHAGVRTHVMKVIAERTKWAPGPAGEHALALVGLQDDNAFVVRAAVDALGRHPAPEDLPLLLDLWRKVSPEDTHLVHTLRIALRDILASLPDLAAVYDMTTDRDTRNRLAGLCLAIRSPGAGQFLLRWLRSDADPGLALDGLAHAARTVAPTSLAGVTEVALHNLGDDPRRRLTAWRGVQRARQERGLGFDDALTAAAVPLVTDWLRSTDEGTQRAGLEFARDLRLAGLAESIVAGLDQGALKPAVLPAAAETLLALDAAQAVPVLARTLRETSLPLDQRQRSAEQLGSLGLPPARAATLESFKLVPEQLALFLARGLAGSKEGAEVLLDATSKGLLPPRLLQDANLAGRLKSAAPPDLEARLADLLKDEPPADERLAKLIGTRKNGFSAVQPDLKLGAEIFGKTCAACHQLGGKGTKVGPELDGIGIRGLDRLLEDTLDPNRNVDQAFRAVVTVLNDGKIVVGLPARKEGNVQIIVDDQGKEQRITPDQIDEQRQTKLSPMPSNVADKLTEAEFYQLIAYLLSQRERKK